MKAMIFAAGLGTRLKPFTDTMPKAMVPVNGRPMLWHQIMKLKAAGVDEIVVNVHHFASQIISYLHENGNFGLTVHISDESAELLDTGGGLLAARRFLEQGDRPFLVHNVDIFSNLDIRAFMESWPDNGEVAMLLASDRTSSRKLLFDGQMRLCGWKNSVSGELRGPAAQGAPYSRELAFGGVHLVSPRIFGLLDAMPQFRGRFGIMDFYLEACRDNAIGAYVPSGLKLTDAGKAGILREIDPDQTFPISGFPQADF